nr:PHB depolymerase family esterase [Ruthenibacterium lactatiformans]
MLFCKARRWSNDTYGTYQKRTDFTARGFVAHVNDPGLGVNEGFAHTWYEYVPPRLRGSKEKAPLVFYFHGIGCVPLYGAEQSGWHDIADRENFIVVYPKPARNKAWNIWDEPGMPSDQAFVLALLEHMKRTYAIDESRVYISGFSMGGMMTNALACAYPELFAAAAPCNGFNSGYLVPASEMWTMLRKMPTGRGLPDGPSEPVTRTRVRADAKKAAFAYRMPLIQSSGLLDGTWPAAQDDPFKRLASFDYWKTYNNIPLTPYEPAAACESGLTADETFYDCADGRFLHHRWFSRDEGKPALFEVVLAKRMPHALDLRQLELAWQFMKGFSRGKDGSLHIDP